MNERPRTTNPYSKSARFSDVTSSPWPVVTRSYLNEALNRNPVEQIEHLSETVNLQVESLALAKVYLINARLRLQRAATLNKANDAVRMRLESLEADLRLIEENFPLTIGGSREQKQQQETT